MISLYGAGKGEDNPSRAENRSQRWKKKKRENVNLWGPRQIHSVLLVVTVIGKLERQSRRVVRESLHCHTVPCGLVRRGGSQ